MTEINGETDRETRNAALAATRMTERELLIHALQHLEDLAEQMAEVRGAVIRFDGTLAVFEPLLRKYAPEGRMDFIGAMQARRDMKRKQHDYPTR